MKISANGVTTKLRTSILSARVSEAIATDPDLSSRVLADTSKLRHYANKIDKGYSVFGLNNNKFAIEHFESAEKAKIYEKRSDQAFDLACLETLEKGFLDKSKPINKLQQTIEKIQPQNRDKIDNYDKDVLIGRLMQFSDNFLFE